MNLFMTAAQTAYHTKRFGVLCGEPLDRVPHGQTVHRTIWPPLLIFFRIGISFSAENDQGRRPLESRHLLKKVDENFSFLSTIENNYIEPLSLS